MIQHSFIFLERIAKRLEQKLWSQGIHHWDTFLQRTTIPGIPTMRKRHYDRKIKQARSALYQQDVSYFTKILPPSEQYRLYDHFKDQAVFLDIETTGFSRQWNDITVVGLCDGYDTKMMVKGINLDVQALKDVLKNYKLLITFNGSRFDIPFINTQYPGVIPNIPHIDVAHITSKVGLKGGLKKVEQLLNINRSKLVQDMHGGDALRLWKMYKVTGDDHYLNLLLEYNEDDITNLKPILEYCIAEIKKTTMPNHAVI